MPNLPMHIYLADEASRELDWGEVFDHVGSFFLGSTAPDIRAMRRWPRERTHFAPLSVEVVGTGARTMFETHPELVEHMGRSPATRAFVLGYISHLVADETWITTMFRPHFSTDNHITATEVEAHIWDRALQLDMDRQCRPEMGNFQNADADLVCADEGVEVGFLTAEDLEEWREWVRRFISWEFSWDRLKRALNRMYRDNDEVQQEVDRFLENMPYSLEHIYSKIPEELIVSYQQRVLENTILRAREFIDGT